MRPLPRPAHRYHVVLTGNHIVDDPLRVAHGGVVVGRLFRHRLATFATRADRRRLVVDETWPEDLGSYGWLAAVADLVEKAANERLVALIGHGRSPQRNTFFQY